MVEIGDTAPDFTVPKAGGEAYNDLEPFTLSDVVSDGPTVLSFYPAAFTSGCTTQMCALRDSMHLFDDLDAQVYGVSVDLPFAQNIWMQQEELNFPMLSDWDHEVIHEYDAVLEDMYGMVEVAERATFVVDTDGMVTYAWVREGDENPDFDDLTERVREAVEDAL